MRIFSALYRRTLVWSRHPHTPWYLSGVSFAESSFFPIPPDVMLAPMSLATPARAWRYALITTLASVAGGAGRLRHRLFRYRRAGGLVARLDLLGKLPDRRGLVRQIRLLGGFRRRLLAHSLQGLHHCRGRPGHGAPALRAGLAHRPWHAFLTGRRPDALGRGAHGGGAAPHRRPHRLGHGGAGGSGHRLALPVLTA